MRQAEARSQFTGMVNKRSKTPKETRTLLVELEGKAKRMEDITGEPIEDGHYKSVILGMIDMDTLRHTVEHQEGRLKKLKRKGMEYMNLIMNADSRGNDSMDLGRTQRHGESPWEVWYKESTD